MDQKRYEEIRKASTRLAEADSRVTVLAESNDVGHILEDAAWPDEIKQTAIAAAKQVLERWAVAEATEARSLWEAL